MSLFSSGECWSACARLGQEMQSILLWGLKKGYIQMTVLENSIQILVLKGNWIRAATPAWLTKWLPASAQDPGTQRLLSSVCHSLESSFPYLVHVSQTVSASLWICFQGLLFKKIFNTWLSSAERRSQNQNNWQPETRRSLLCVS